MTTLNILLLAGGLLVALSLVAGLYSVRIGLSFLLVFLVAGMLAGEDGPLGVPFDNHTLAFWVGNAALAVILLDGGLRTRFRTFRAGLVPALWLATLGVLVTAAVTGAAAMWALELDWKAGLLVGAIVGSTDAAAVFAQLKSSGVRLNERLGATLEIESGLNDPMAIFLTLAMIAAITQPKGLAGLPLLLLQQSGVGLAMGLGSGIAVAALLNRLPLEHDHDGVRGLILVSSGVAVFGATGLLGGSGFLAVYLFGLMVGNRASEVVEGGLPAMDGFAWLAQAGMFLLLGLLVTPHELLQPIVPALGVAAVLMFAARPLAVWLCLTPLHVPPRERAFVAWVGLRGAVPIVLAVFPVIAQVPGAERFFDVAFVVVLASLLLQGTSLGWVARRLGLQLPARDDAAGLRRVFGDFVLDPAMPAASLCGFYGLREPEDPQRPLARWMEDELKRPPVPGDAIEWDGARLSVRAMRDDRITAVGLTLGAAP